MTAGIDHARGNVLITMDGDLQNDPADIPLFLDKIAEGYDLVVGWRHQRQDHFSRVLPSKVANWLIARVTGVPIKDNGCSLKAYRAELIKRIPLYSEMHRFIPAMASLAAPRLAQIKVRHHPRQFGKSKYGPESRRVTLIRDMIDSGHGQRLLIGNDLGRPSYWRAYGGGPGLDFVLTSFRARLRQEGFTEDELTMLFIDNPRRFFAGER